MTSRLFGVLIMIDLEVFAVGNLNIDLIGRMEKLPAPDEKILIEEFARCPGGGAANFAVASSKLGLGSGFIGHVGCDDFGDEILEDLERRGVDTTHVTKVDAPTGIALVLSTLGSERFLIEYRGANSFLRPEDLEDEYLEGGKLIHASSVTPEMALVVGSKARELGLKASLDIGAELTKVNRAKLFDILEYFDICFMNEETFQNIFSEKATERNILESFPEGLETFVITLGAEGAIATDGEKAVSSSTYGVEVRDTTGAGDAFAAAFDKLSLEGVSLKESIDFATAEAAIKVQHVGAREGLPTMEELKKFVQNQNPS